MRTRTVFECEICKKRYEKKREAFECEANCLGLTEVEYLEYIDLLKEEKKAYAFVSHTNNQYTRKKCDDTTNAVIEFQNKHNLKSDIELRI